MKIPEFCNFATQLLFGWTAMDPKQTFLKNHLVSLEFAEASIHYDESLILSQIIIKLEVELVSGRNISIL